MKSEKSKKMKPWVKIILAITVLICVLVIIFICKWMNRPDSNEIVTRMERKYQKEFQIVEEFTYIAHTDGEAETQRELKCPAVVLQDKENTDICFIAYAYPLEGGDWIYRDNYFQKALIYCINQEQLEMNNEAQCGAPCLVLENTDETAQKLQNMVIRFNELCQYDVELCQSDDSYGYVGSYATFMVEGVSLAYQVQGGNISDRWLDETSPFCYDTPIEKYKAFLDELEEYLKT